MNSVHEPGPNDDSETILSRKTRSKTKPGARAPKLVQLGTQARPGVRTLSRVMGAAAVSWLWPPAVSQGVIAVSWPSAARARAVSQRASARPCAMSQDTPLLARLSKSRYKTWPCNTIPYQPCSLSHNRSSVLRYTFCLAYPLPVTIHFGLYRDMLIPQPAYLSITIQSVYCDTLFSPPSLQPVAIQCLILQYNPLPKLATSQPHQVTIQWLYRDPVSMLTWAVAQSRFLHHFFIFFIFIFIIIIFCYWKILKIHSSIFFLILQKYPNKFIKFYFP